MGPYESFIKEVFNTFNTINNFINYDGCCNNSKHDKNDENIIDVEYREVDIDDDREIV